MPRKDLIRTTASVDGVPLGEFTGFSGGELTSASVKGPRGAGQADVARGGRQSVGDVTITREDDGAVDIKWLASRRGKAPMVVTRTPLDDDGNPKAAKSITYTGKLRDVNPGDADSRSDGEFDDFTLIMDCDGRVG